MDPLFIEISDGKRRVLLNLAHVFGVIDDGANAVAVSVQGATTPLPVTYEEARDLIADAIEEEPDEGESN